MSASRSRGFTLIELMVTLAVAAILLTIGVPSFRDLMIKSRLSGQVQEFYGTLNFARSEAIKRGFSVSICKSSNGTSCTGNWSDGWIIFLDSDEDKDTVNSDEILRIFPALPTNITLNANTPFTNYITYNRFGMANTNGTFVFCENSDESKARAIVITRTRPRIAAAGGSEIGNCENP